MLCQSPVLVPSSYIYAINDVTVGKKKNLECIFEFLSRPCLSVVIHWGLKGGIWKYDIVRVLCTTAIIKIVKITLN